MEQKKGKSLFNRKIVSEDNEPRIYIVPSSEKPESPSKRPSVPDSRKKEKEAPSFFFGLRIGKLLSARKTETEELPSIDKELESSLEVVQKKLQRTPAAQIKEEGRMSKEQLKHQRFIEERNSAQEALFGDIVRYHQEFGTGLSTEDLWSLHDSMKKVVDREVVESSEQPLHEHVEYHFIRFLRSKALEQAWQRLEEYVARFGIPFPISSSMMDPKDPLRNERVKEESKRLAKGDFLNMRARELSELMLGNVPAWVYSYPAKDSYLWQLTVLRGIAAGLGADLLMKYLALWEANSADILKKIEQEFKEKIGSLRRRGEAATDLAEVFSVSMELQRISREEIPHRIWEYVSQRLTGL